jgi:hypothetical protein
MLGCSGILKIGKIVYNINGLFFIGGIMKNSVKAVKNYVVMFVIFFTAISPAFSQITQLEELKNTTDKLIENLAEVLPFNSTIGLNWSDSFIGQMPPHFGIGISAGFTTMDFTAISGLMKLFGTSVPLDSIMFGSNGLFSFPAYTVEARIGGIKIPLDIGLKFGLLTPDFSKSQIEKFFKGVDLGIDYLLLGADFRYALLNNKVFPLCVSIGFGVNYLRGGIEKAFLQGVSIDGPAYGIKLSQSSSKLEFQWSTINFEFKPQISFPLKILTPYAGAGLSYSMTNAGYSVTTAGLKVTNPGNTLNEDEIKELLKKEFGITEISDKGFENTKNLSKFNIRAFGGFSVNLIFVRFDLTAMYNVLSGNLGATLGLRFQL